MTTARQSGLTMTISRLKIVLFSKGKTLSLGCHLKRIQYEICKLRVVEDIENKQNVTWNSLLLCYFHTADMADKFTD